MNTVGTPTLRTRTRQSLSVRLLVLVLSVVVLIEGLIFIPGLQRERIRWLTERLRYAQWVVLVVPSGAQIHSLPGVLDKLVTLSGAELIGVVRPDGMRQVIGPARAIVPNGRVDLDHERWSQGFFAALADLVQPDLRPRGRRRLEILGTSQLGQRIEAIVPQAPLQRFLREYTRRFASISLAVAMVSGTLLFAALRAMLVLPLRRIASSIAAFRRNPEQGVPLDAERVSVVHDDEITMVGRELAGLQAELRTALWRNARLAAVGTAVAKMSHDLRGILSSAMLVADRLTMSRDEPTRQAGEVIVQAVLRATALAQHTLDFVREGPPALTRSRTGLRALIDQAAAQVCEPAHSCDVRNTVAEAAEADVDRESVLRVLTNLFRNAIQAGGRIITVSGTGTQAATVLTVTDDGPGLPEPVRDRLFQPFVSSFRSGGSGLGLAIARDLMRAHGGDLRLAHTGPTGTSFTLFLQAPPHAEG